MLPVLQRLENIKWLWLFQWNLWQKSKVETVSAFRFFWFFNFSMFSTSRFFFKICRDFRLFEQKSIGLQALRFFFWSFRLFAAERYAFHGVTVTSQKGTQRLSGLCSKGIKITVTALEGWLGLRESSPNYRKFQVSEIYCNTQIRLVTHFPVFGSDFHIEDSCPNEQVKSENFPKCASSFFVDRFVTWCSCTHTYRCAPNKIYLHIHSFVPTHQYLHLCMYIT